MVRTTMRHRWLMVACSMVALLAASPAVAGTEDGDVEFDTLDVETTRHDQLRINYKFDRGSWRWMKRKGVAPNLSVWTDEHHDSEAPRFAWGHALSSRAGSFTLPQAVDISEGDAVEIGVNGFAGTWRIRSLRRGSLSGPRLVFEYDDDSFDVSARSSRRCRLGGGAGGDDDEGRDRHDRDDDRRGHGDWDGHDHHHGHGDHGEDDHDERRDRHHDHGSDGREEEDNDQAPPGWKASTIKACKQHVQFDSDMEECTQKALNIEPRWAVEAVKACGESVQFESDLTECLEVAKQHDTFNPADAVRACNDVVQFESDLLDCFEMTADYASKPGPILRACKASVEFESDIEDCVELGKKLDAREGPELIRACSGGEWKSCVNNAAGR